MFRATALIVAKDLRTQLRNGTVLILGFVAPLVLSFVLNLVFGGMADPDAPVTFAAGLVDLDGGPQAEGFAAILEDLTDTGLVDLDRFDDELAGRRAVDEGDVNAIWVLPAGFSKAMASGQDVEITVVGDVDSPNTASFARALAERYGLGVGTSTLAGLVALDTGVATPDQIGAIAEEAASSPPSARLGSIESASSVLDLTTSLTAGMAVFFVFFTAGLPLVSIIEERGRGTLARLLVAPIPGSAILAGKALAAIILGSISLAALMLASGLVMGADWGAPAGALALAVGAVVAAAGIMSVTAAFARSTEQAGNLQSIVAVVLGLLGGTFVPLPGSGTGILAQLRLLTPQGWFLDGLTELRADGFTGAIPALLILLAIGAVTGAVGLRLASSGLRR